MGNRLNCMQAIKIGRIYIPQEFIRKCHISLNDFFEFFWCGILLIDFAEQIHQIDFCRTYFLDANMFRFAEKIALEIGKT